MTIEMWKEEFPKLFSRLSEEEIDTLRDLIVIDENENDGDVDELDEVDSEEYNYIVYITERLRDAIGGEERLIDLVKRLDADDTFEDYFPSELDLYGIKTDLGNEQIARVVLKAAEEMVV
jgi:hypothetical protein